jgi:hypothetical protein
MAEGKANSAKKAPKLGQSPQARWMRKQQEQGKCRACGKERPPELRQLCRPCQHKFNAYMKTRRRAIREALKAKQATVSDSSSAEQKSVRGQTS